MDDVRAKAQRLAQEHLANGNFIAWFEALYAGADGNATMIPWADLTVDPNLAEWANRSALRGDNRRALVVGCGLGDDAEALAGLGFGVTAFDIAPTAIAWCRRRFPRTRVDYVVADLLAPPESWTAAFDFVFEAYTLQSLPADLRRRAVGSVVRFVAPGGTLLVICRGRDPGPEPPGPPWALVRSELDAFVGEGLTETSFEDYVDREDPPTRRFRAVYRR